MKRKKYETPQLDLQCVELQCVMLSGSDFSVGGGLPDDKNDNDFDFDITDIIFRP